MKKNILFLLLLTMSYQAAASQSYNKLMDLVVQCRLINQDDRYDLSEHSSTVIFSRMNNEGRKEQILKLSGAAFTLVSGLAEQERVNLPHILIAAPGSYAMKFFCSHGCCSYKRITAEEPTIDDLNRENIRVRCFRFR
ncbi:hypothetical protein KBC04_05645 [Candidatus Babeliales bacterium]|nr:hypothetical protein [Candidatus Babeliales bacterium]MBP9844397.1 hypothetical protein [Candidatus Babeliales bacterium]